MDQHDNDILPILLDALEASMEVVGTYQGGHLPSDIEHKADNTIVTVADKASESAAAAILQERLTGFDFHFEERGQVGNAESRYSVWVDPLDGTAPFANGANTSTVIIAVNDNERKRVTHCLVGEPGVTGKIWYAIEGQGTEIIDRLDFSDQDHPARVWDGTLNPKSGVLLDLYPDFRGKGYEALSNEEQHKLFSLLFGKAQIRMLGSNGYHHALVANGGEGMAGAITVAYGGPWDCAPVLLVLEAGGAARAFSTDGQYFIEQHPLDVMSYRFLVTGNNQETVDTLSTALFELRPLK